MNLVIMRFLSHFCSKEIRGKNLQFPHVKHDPSIPLLVPEERAMRRVFTMLGHLHLLLVDSCHRMKNIFPHVYPAAPVRHSTGNFHQEK